MDDEGRRPMNVKILSCWFTTSYGTYTDGLRRGLERLLGEEVGIIASNCGCGDPMEVSRRLMDRRCEFVEFPNVPDWRMSNAAKQLVMDVSRLVVYRERARRFIRCGAEADVLHFQQTLNAFGSLALFEWLAMPARAARVVTVHELDPAQLAHPERNAAYEKADGIIVHTEAMREELVELGVSRHKIAVVKHGVEIRPLVDGPRSGIVFWGGHKLSGSKGLGTLLTALALLKGKLGSRTPTLTIHGHYGAETPEHAARAAREAGVADKIRWLNEIPFEDAVAEYRRAQLCVVPFTGSFAGYPVALAMASGLPVIGTRRAGLPEHLGSFGVWVEEDDPHGLSAAISRMIEDEASWRRISGAVRSRAVEELSWDAVAAATLAVYRDALQSKRQISLPASRWPEPRQGAPSHARRS
jgi:glycosyltransferase involved in cell wall biosynthesis